MLQRIKYHRLTLTAISPNAPKINANIAIAAPTAISGVTPVSIKYV